MTRSTTRPLLAAALAAGLLVPALPAAAQVPAPLPLETRSERMIGQTNRDLRLQRRITESEQQRTFEQNQLRQRIDRLEMFPPVAPPPTTPGLR